MRLLLVSVVAAFLPISTPLSADGSVAPGTGLSPKEPAAQQQQLCAVIADARAQAASLQQEKKREGNPLRADTIEQQLRKVLANAVQSILAIIGPTQFSGYVGRVRAITDEGSSWAKKYGMAVDLGCKSAPVVLGFTFSDLGTDLELHGATRLAEFQSTLGELNRGDWIEIRGAFTNPQLNWTLPNFVLNNTVGFGARATSIQKLRP